MRLRASLSSFDEVAVHTLHGFCHRVLREHAFDGGQPQDAETDDSGLITLEVARRYCRRLYQADDAVTAALGELSRPEKLVGNPVLSSCLGRSDLRTLPSLTVDMADWPAALGQILTGPVEHRRQLWDQAAQCWNREEIEGSLLAGNLNQRSYKPKSVSAAMDEIEHLLNNRQAALPDKLNKSFDLCTTDKLRRNTKKGGEPPTHPFFSLCDQLKTACDDLAAAHIHCRSLWLRGWLDYAGDELKRRTLAAGVITYRDMLLRLSDALSDENLAQTLRRRFPAALIDEFQDTDDTQYGIIQRIYALNDAQEAAAPVFLVGDPKQSIYRFRNADVYTYLRAAADAGAAGGTHRLLRNWRSHPTLVRAVATLFDKDDPFMLQSRVDPPAAEPARTAEDRPSLVIDGKPHSPMSVWDMGECGNKEAVTEQVAELCARQIRLLLDKATLGDDGDALHGRDIAVLTLTHDQGNAVRRHLRRHRIRASTSARDNVLKTPTADDLAVILTAILKPARDRSVRAALATELFRLPADRLCAADEAVNDLWARFYEWHETWRDEGFTPMFHRLLHDQLAPRVAGGMDGERRLTDLRHIADLLQEAIVTEAAPMGSVPELYARLRAERDDGHRLHLEGDSDLVHIVTVHASKGLQYPVVFCPFHWETGNTAAFRRNEPFIFHDPDDQQWRATLCLSPRDPSAEGASKQHESEELSERLRLLYVSVTRAQNACYLFYGTPGSAKSATVFGHLFPDGTGRLQGKAGIALASADEMKTDAASQRRPQRSSVPAEDLQARSLTAGLPEGQRTVSFTGLTRGAPEAPDYDAVATPVIAEPEAGGPDIFTFPRGGHAGQFWHQVLEKTDFTAAENGRTGERLRSLLSAYGFHSFWHEILSVYIPRLLRTPLASGGLGPEDETPFCLADIRNEQRLNELEFWYPVPDFSVHVLMDHLRPHLTAARAASLERLPADRARGYMRGFIDLVFAHRNRYYLADYKSNWLGYAPADYVPERLEGAMMQHQYHLQYLIYSIALHRHLQQRLSDYSYEKHFGGVYYLFLRGMGTDGSTGVYYDKPPSALIEAMDAYVG